MVSCATAVSYDMVEDNETQCLGPFRIRIGPEHAEIGRTASQVLMTLVSGSWLSLLL